MADLDLSDPQHLAELLRDCLPGFDEETSEQVATHLGALGASDNDVFAHIGVGHRVVEDDDVTAEPGADLGQDAQQGQQTQQGQLAEPGELQDQAQAPDQADLPLDMGGEGQLLEDEEGLEIAGMPPVRARRASWTEIDRYRSKGKHEVYDLAASHTRSKPIRSAFTGRAQAVRVSLPVAKPGADAFIGTFIGTVEARDHLAFSVDEVAELFAQEFGQRPSLARVDLITGARFRGRRFSPVSIFLAYSDTGPEAKPVFYLLEGGKASGKPAAMYLSRTMSTEVKTQSDFAFTPFACKSNWYEGGLAMSADLSEPACVYLTVTQTRDGRHEYLKLSVIFDRDRDLRRVVHPFELQIEAALRVMAIADEARCQLRTGSGGGLQHGLGPIVRALMQWKQKPEGSTTPQERRQFCGCPKN